MSPPDATTFTTYEVLAITAIATVGLTAIVAVGGGGRLVPMILIFGLFVLLPLVYVIGDRLPMIDSPTETSGDDTSPVEALRTQYVTGELTDEEFERRLDDLLEPSGRVEGKNMEEDRSPQPMAERERR